METKVEVDEKRLSNRRARIELLEQIYADLENEVAKLPDDRELN